jgi:hypothetical protein
MLLAWLGFAHLACLDTKSQILSTCKSRQVHITSKKNTNSTNNLHRDIHSTSSYILADELVWPAGSRQNFYLEQKEPVTQHDIYSVTTFAGTNCKIR